MDLGWGILGCGRIASSAMAPAIGWSQNGRLVAVASRDARTAERKANALRAAHGHGSYDALLADPEVHAVYIGLPNGLHAQWALRAAEAGKHVLCEKSLTLSGSVARQLSDAFGARGLRLVEGFMYRHHPQWEIVRSLLDEGAVGNVRHLRAWLTGAASRGDHRFSPTLGGGALFDVTCYAVNVARFLLRTEPLRVAAVADVLAPEGVDVSTQASIEFPGDVLVSAFGSLAMAPDQGVVVLGSEGRLEVPRPFAPGWGATEIAVVRGEERRAVHVGGANHFLHQVEHFASLVADPTRPAWPAEDGLLNVLACESIASSYSERRDCPSLDPS